MSVNYILPFATLLYISALLVAVRVVTGGWRNYSAGLIVILVMTIFIPLLFSSGFYVSPIGILFLFNAGFVFFAGLMLGRALINPGNGRKSSFDPSIFLGIDLTVLWFVGLCCGITAIGLSIGEDIRLTSAFEFYQSIAEISVKNASGRYRGLSEPSVLQSVLMSVTYFSCLLSGAKVAALRISSGDKKIPALLSVAPIFLLAVFGVLQNTKATMLYGGVLYFSGYYSIYLFEPSRHPAVTTKFRFFLKYLFIISVIMALFILMQSVRYGVLFLSVDEIYRMFVEYALVHVSGFQFWFDNYYDHGKSLGLGAITFAGVANLFSDSIQGGSTVLQEKYVSPDFSTNINTVFADLIQDFGISGALVFMLIAGILGGLADRFRQLKYTIWAPVGVVLFALLLWGFTTSILKYSSICLSLAMFFVFIFYRMILKNIARIGRSRSVI